MPTADQNREKWGQAYEWPDAGDEWSAGWGDTETMWHATVLPRIRHFIPAGRVVEIAPGYGRWTRYLIPASQDFIGVDIAAECVEACRVRFSDARAAFHVTDGSSLPGVEADSADFVFSLDSLVHAEAPEMRGYVKELARVLTADGVAFLHHSNLAEYASRAKLARSLNARIEGRGLVERAAWKTGVVGWDHWRGITVSAEAVAAMCREVGLECVGQELVPWDDRRPSWLVDCLTVIARPGSRWSRPRVKVRNRDFLGEAHSADVISRVYA